MADMNDMVKLAIDGYKGRVEKYSTSQSQDAIRQGLIELNNGSTMLDYRNIRDGKCPGLFSYIETVIDKLTIEGLQANDFFNEFVEYKNVAEGDKNEFLVKDSTLFTVDDVSNGNLGIRRQRLGGYTEVTIPTSYKAIRIYEELNRVLSGRVDFNEFITKVSDSFLQKTLNDIFSLWSGVTATDLGGTACFPTAGSYDEDALLDTIAHVEAAAGGKNATIIGTKKALRKIKESIESDSAKDEIHNLGYYGKFNGTPVVALPQRHKIGTTDFVFDDDVLTIVAGDDRPIKFVYEGSPTVVMGDPLTNADSTQEYFYGTKYGLGIVLAGGNAGIGRYEIQ